jgi:2-polyprenyl-6-methoxyphenol hydroxylase-like FAD-dependent oxidoreductase
MSRSDVLIIGAGPSGLVLALWLNKLGVNVAGLAGARAHP